MEIVQKYTIGFHEVLSLFNTLPPNIEPTATGHIIEQVEMIKEIMAAGFAYEVNGSVYFDVEKYSRHHDYGMLTNRKLEDLLEGTRELSGQDEKRGRLDFALWIKANPETLMQWPSPWGPGFPGLAYRMFSHEHQILRYFVRYSWWRNGPSGNSPHQ